MPPRQVESPKEKEWDTIIVNAYESANRGDVRGTQQATTEAKSFIDANYKDPKENKVKQEEFLRTVNKGIEKPENKVMFLGVALQVGFAREAVLAVSAFNDRINHEQTTSMTVASFRELGAALLQVINDCLQNEEEEKIKKALKDKMKILEGLGVGEREEKPGSKTYDKYVKDIDAVLKDKIPVSVVSLVSFHASGGNNMTASKNMEFSKMDPA